MYVCMCVCVCVCDIALYAEQNITCLLYCIAWVSGYRPFKGYASNDSCAKWFEVHLPNILETQNIKYNVIGTNWSVDKNLNLDVLFLL